MYDYHLSDGTPIFSSDADVADFASPQATSYGIIASPAPPSVTSSSSVQSVTSHNTPINSPYALSPAFVPAFEELGLISNSDMSDVIERTNELDTGGSSLCPICGNEAGKHVHYGGRACTSCRAFFRRSVQVFEHKKIVRLFLITALKCRKIMFRHKPRQESYVIRILQQFLLSTELGFIIVPRFCVP